MRNLTPSTLTALPHATHRLADLEAAFNARRGELATQELGSVTWWAHQPRQAPRDGRGRFLSKAWLQRAETYSAADLAFFRSPLGC